MNSASQLKKPCSWEQQISEEWNTPVDSACIGVAENMPTENILHLATDLGFNHIVQKQGHCFDSEMRTCNALIGAEEGYLEFPIATILSPHALNCAAEKSFILFDMQFNTSTLKRQVIADVTKVAQSKGLSQTLLDDVVSVTDELFTNAMFNAPFVDINTQKNPGINRHTDEVKLADGKICRLFVAADEHRLVVGCSDPFGSLDLKRYLNKIKATYVRGPAATMNFGPGGAGIGSYMIFNAGSSLYFGVWPGKATTLCCVVPLKMSNRKRAELPKNLHWIQR